MSSIKEKIKQISPSEFFYSKLDLAGFSNPTRSLYTAVKEFDENAMTLLKDENALHVIDLREFVGKSNANVERIKGRIIGEGGRARRNMENLSGTHISIYGKTVSIIGDSNKLRLAVDAISSISSGSMHGAVYTKLEAANRKEKEEKMKLWEDRDVFY